MFQDSFRAPRIRARTERRASPTPAANLIAGNNNSTFLNKFHDVAMTTWRGGIFQIEFWKLKKILCWRVLFICIRSASVGEREKKKSKTRAAFEHFGSWGVAFVGFRMLTKNIMHQWNGEES